jgi:hypothetical protein
MISELDIWLTPRKGFDPPRRPSFKYVEEQSLKTWELDRPKEYFWYFPLIFLIVSKILKHLEKVYLTSNYVPLWYLRFSRALMKIQVIWNITACALVNSCRRFGAEYCLHFQGKIVQEECFILKTQVPCSSETLVSFYHMAHPWRFKLHMCRCCLKCLFEKVFYLIYI